MSKLIILRGNSGSGKTTIARGLQEKFGYGTMLISQDVVRREMLYVKDSERPKAKELLYLLAMYGKKHCDIVIMEGILNSEWYKDLFKQLKKDFGENIYAYYFDVPFEETLKRHRTRKCKDEFGEEEMKKWWNEKDLLNFISETLLKKELTIDEIINMIYEEVK